MISQIEHLILLGGYSSNSKPFFSNELVEVQLGNVSVKSPSVAKTPQADADDSETDKQLNN